MAIAKVRDGGSLADKVSGTTIVATVPAAGHAVGNLVLVTIGSFHSSLTNQHPTSVVDTQGNSDTLLHSHGPGATGYEVYATVVASGMALVSGNTITATYASAMDGRAIVATEFSGATITEDVASVGNALTNGTPAAGPITPPSAATLVVAGLGIRGPTGETFTQDADTQGGPVWTALPLAGTSGGSATTNICLRVSYKITTSSAAQTWSPLITSRSWATSIVALQEAVVVAGIPEINMAPMRS